MSQAKTVKATTTAGELIRRLQALPSNQAVAFPVQWTKEVLELQWKDDLATQLTDEQWEDVAEDFMDALGPAFWEDSYEAMRYVLEEKNYLKEED